MDKQRCMEVLNKLYGDAVYLGTASEGKGKNQYEEQAEALALAMQIVKESDEK